MDWVTGPLSDNWVTALYVMIRQHGQRGHERVGGEFKWFITLTRADAMEYLKQIILHLHFDECFVKEPLGAGEIPTKQNSEYVNVFTTLL